MVREVIGSVRRSSLVSTFGVGSLLPAGEDSVMVCGLDDWPRGEEIEEPRLAASLGVAGFRSPPAGFKGGDIPAVRFPVWVFCTACRRLGPWWEIASSGERLCDHCNEGTSPSRFVVCCSNGHIEDFPYRAWVHETGHVEPAGHELRLVSRGHTSSLADILVSCSCGRSRSMNGAFDFGAFRGLRACSGARPWLATNDERCTAELRTLQRGSSNVWFAATRSAISIPSIDHVADLFVRRNLRDVAPDAPSDLVASMFNPPVGLDRDDVRCAIDRMRAPVASSAVVSDRDLRSEEYRALVAGSASFADDAMFRCDAVDIGNVDLPKVVAQVARVGRLREVRALVGFTRLVPPADSSTATLAPLDDTGKVHWLPAVEVLGEGVFIRLDADILDSWARSPLAVRRSGELLRTRARAGENSLSAGMDVSPKSLALHSLAHVLVDEMSLSSGYPAAAIRERIYDADDQAGVLVYTASADSAGSLGGLAAVSEPHRFAQTLINGLERARWCTADPVCAESSGSGIDGMNLAACHACLLLPEVSCERFNLGLDRISLVGSPGSLVGGLFSESLA